MNKQNRNSEIIENENSRLQEKNSDLIGRGVIDLLDVPKIYLMCDEFSYLDHNEENTGNFLLDN